MFTGLVEELGTLVARNSSGTSLRLQIEAETVFSDLKIDDSIAIDGCCQTVIRVAPPIFEVIAVRETLEKTTLGSLPIGSKVNLERAATLSTRMGGHLVQGHIDGRAQVAEIRDLAGSWEFFFDLPGGYERYAMPIGSIALNGVSLTIASIHDRRIKIAIIPHTHEVTNFRWLAPGMEVNVELDMIAKMVERFVGAATGGNLAP